MSCHELRRQPRSARQGPRPRRGEVARRSSLPMLGQPAAGVRRRGAPLAQPRGARRATARRPAPPTNSRPARDELDGASRAAGSCSCSACRRRWPAWARPAASRNEKIVPFVRRPEEVTPGNPLHFATAYALDGYASGLLVDEPRRAPDQGRGQPRPPADAGRDDAVRAGADPGPLRRRSRQAAPRGGDGRSPGATFLAEIARCARPGWRPTAAPGCAS